MDYSLPDDRTLGRLAATLVALAVLAERAACRSFPVRWMVLTILRHGEAVILAFVTEATRTDWPGFDEPAGTGASRRDAALLSLRLRALAALVEGLRVFAALLECSRIVRPQARQPHQESPEAVPARPPRPADTS